MHFRWFLFALIFAVNVTALANDKSPAPDAARTVAWQNALEHAKFDLKEDERGVMYSLSQFQGDCKIEMIYDPAQHWGLTFKLIHSGKEIATMEGSTDAVFCGTKGVFYFAQFSNQSCGCRVLAFNTTTGAKLWERDLIAAGVIDHSKYTNHVTMRRGPFSPDEGAKFLSDMDQNRGSLIISGSEGAGDYVEVLDMETGAVLAHKVYRKV